MISLKKLALGSALLATVVTMSFGHLPSLNDASLQMGRAGGPNNSRARATWIPTKYGAWDADSVYRGDHANGVGDTVSHGTFNGKQLWWWAKFYAAGADFEPGYFAPQGGTSPWVLINSLSAISSGTVNYQWAGWNGDMDGLGSMQAGVPTWRDGAEGAYSFTHDDIGAMPFDLSVQPGWDVAKNYPDIKTCWGVYVEKMSSEDWTAAREMVLEGHEMFNHSMEHTSAADQWQWFYPGQIVPSHDPAIPADLRGLEVVGTWGDPARAPAWPIASYEKTFESPLVAIMATMYWTQNAPSTEPVGTDLIDEASGTKLTTVIEPVIYAKPGVTELTLELTGQKQYVKYDVYDSSAEPTHTGQLAATGATWLEMEQLDEFGGLFWQPDKPFDLTPPLEFSALPWDGKEIGTICTHEGKYWEATGPGPNHLVPGVGDWEGNEYWTEISYDPSSIQPSSEGSYVGSAWSSSTANVAGDKGAPGYVAKVWCVTKWSPPEYKLNIQDANDSINKYIYEPIVTSAEYFKKDKRSEYFGYPFDAYSEVTHDSLEQAGFVGARGGAKSGQPIPGDFFHPYRIDFDAFYITDPSYTESATDSIHLYPNNPHVLMGMNEMVDSIISTKGYMIREFHAVASIASGAWSSAEPSEQWPLNSAAKGAGGWWGGVPDYMLDAHYSYIQGKIDANQLAVYTVGEVTKYRMTANATSTAAITKAGADYEVTATTIEDIPAKYREEISIIVSLDAAVDSFNAYYKTPDAAWGDTPRRRPVKMDAAGLKWSVNMQPFLGTVVLEPNAAWTGPGTVVDTVITPVSSRLAQGAQSIRMQGIQSGQISLRLPVGAYTAKVFNAQGRLIRSTNITSSGGVVATGLRTNSMSNGLYFLQVKQAGAQVFQEKFIVR